ncbi:acyl-CoA dehydrogenase family protein [Streptomyces sp. NPDC057638]|uniref:acyl-CoA dehydrogenase family protein n=1 Tax=Streptomyces sp. NPDC057638 TaxID=3346190 RepID=UPI0036A3074F
MRFLLTPEQEAFGEALDALLGAADTPAAARAWGAGQTGPGLALWSRLAAAGLFVPAVPEEHGGAGLLPVDLAVAFTALGRHAVPGPLVETAAAAVLLAGAECPAVARRLLPGLLAGDPYTLVLAGEGPYALDADTAAVLVVEEDGPLLRLAPGGGAVRVSQDPVRRLARPLDGGELLAGGPGVRAAAARAARMARLLTAAQALGVGLALLDRTVAYVKERRQFGVPVGSFQAVGHRLADTLIALEFARALVFGAAVTFDAGDVAAAKVRAGEAAYGAARAALQFHGAIGYTAELDLSLWLRKARPLRDAWGTPATCRATLLP